MVRRQNPWIDRGTALAMVCIAGLVSGQQRSPWSSVLDRHVADGGVRYSELERSRDDLAAFVATLAPGPRTELAFWINAYNAIVLARLLEQDSRPASVRQIDGFFDRRTTAVAGQQLTLDAIERRARELDPRAHFALVCAAESCPDLRAEPYERASLERQLEDQTRRFLADRGKGLRYDERANALWLSPIFDWYAGDFRVNGAVNVVGWILPHLPEPLASTIRERQPAISYLDYDWRLNDRKSRDRP